MMKAERLAEIKAFNPKPTDLVDWEKLQKAVLEYLPELIAEVERLREALQQSVETEFRYAIALSKIACDSQYFNVAASSRGGERLIEIAKEALQNGD